MNMIKQPITSTVTLASGGNYRRNYYALCFRFAFAPRSQSVDIFEYTTFTANWPWRFHQ